MQKQFIISEDGSTTIFLPELNEHYHSHFGAVQEAQHIFVNNGIAASPTSDLDILEVGFGTGLNAFLTAVYSLEHNLSVRYTGIEPYPLNLEELQHLNYVEFVDPQHKSIFTQISNPQGFSSPFFSLTKEQLTIEEYLTIHNPESQFDIIYFDAFGPDVQPHMWSSSIFKSLFKSLKPDGFLITYSCKGPVKRALQDAGFKINKLPGPKGKREITKAIKNIAI